MGREIFLRGVVEMRVMVVDDQVGIRALLAEVVKQEGFQVVLAGNAREALAKFSEGPPDLLLLDVKLPGMSGLELLRKIRDTHPHLPVVLMTAYGERDIEEEAKRLGVHAFLIKPFDIEHLRELLDRFRGGASSNSLL
ncbi:MAG: response regulator [Brockia lithotrophica]|nr:response regulator [Brockia lithotrophica]